MFDREALMTKTSQEGDRRRCPSLPSEEHGERTIGVAAAPDVVLSSSPHPHAAAVKEGVRWSTPRGAPVAALTRSAAPGKLPARAAGQRSPFSGTTAPPRSAGAATSISMTNSLNPILAAGPKPAPSGRGFTDGSGSNSAAAQNKVSKQ